MSLRSKGLTQVGDLGARAALDGISKQAALDLIVDLVRRFHGDHQLDGRELIEAVSKEFEPIAHIRGDRLPRYPRKR